GRSAKGRVAVSGSERQQDLRGTESGRLISRSASLCEASCCHRAGVARRATATEESLRAQIFAEWLIIEIQLFDRGIAAENADADIRVLVPSAAQISIGSFGGGSVAFRHPIFVKRQGNGFSEKARFHEIIAGRFSR